MAIKYIIVLFVETPRKFITAKLSIRKPGSSSVLIYRKLCSNKFTWCFHKQNIITNKYSGLKTSYEINTYTRAIFKFF